MRIANWSMLGVLALAFACSSSSDEPGGAAGAAGSSSGSGGAAGSSSGGSVAQPSAGTPSSSGGPAGGSNSTAGTATGGKAGGGAAGAAGSSQGGAAAGSAGASGGPTGGSSGGGGGSCVKNLACKLNPPPTTGDLYQDCVDRINQFLTQCACLPALKRRMDGEACADQMAKYDAEQDSPHAGTIAKICTPGGAQNECPEYASNNQVIGLCMQQMWDEGPPPTANCTGACYETHGHFINMTDTSVKQVACGFHTTASGKVWAVQNFSR